MLVIPTSGTIISHICKTLAVTDSRNRFCPTIADHVMRLVFPFPFALTSTLKSDIAALAGYCTLLKKQTASTAEPSDGACHAAEAIGYQNQWVLLLQTEGLIAAPQDFAISLLPHLQLWAIQHWAQHPGLVEGNLKDTVNAKSCHKQLKRWHGKILLKRRICLLKYLYRVACGLLVEGAAHLARGAESHLPRQLVAGGPPD